MSVALDSIKWQTVYPMDYYANDSLGAWTNNNEAHRPVRQRKPRPIISSKGEKTVLKKDNLMLNKDKLPSGSANMNSQLNSCTVQVCAGKTVSSKEDNRLPQTKLDGADTCIKTGNCCNTSSATDSCVKTGTSNS